MDAHTHWAVDLHTNRRQELRAACRSWVHIRTITGSPTCHRCRDAQTRYSDLVDAMFPETKMTTPTTVEPTVDPFDGPIEFELDADPTAAPAPPAADAPTRELTYVPVDTAAHTEPQPAPAVELSEDQIIVNTSLRHAPVTVTLFGQGNELVLLSQHARTVAAADATPAQIVTAKELFSTMFEFEKAVHAHYDPHCSRLYESWKAMTDERGQAVKPSEAERKLLGEWVATAERVIRDREAAEERERQRKAQQEQDARAEREAKERLQAGDVDGATKVLAESRMMPATVAPRPSVLPATTGGPKTTKRWVAVIDDWPKMRAAIGEGKYPELDAALQDVMQRHLQGLAAKFNTTLADKYPGAHAEQKASLAGR